MDRIADLIRNIRATDYGGCYTLNGRDWKCRMGFKNPTDACEFLVRIEDIDPLDTKFVLLPYWYSKRVKERLISLSLSPEVNILTSESPGH